MLSGEAVEAASRSVRARITNHLLAPSDPAYPITHGGDFWAGFMQSLEGRWEQAREETHREEEEQEPDPQLTLIESATAADGGGRSNG